MDLVFAWCFFYKDVISSASIDGARNYFTIELTDVFVTIRTEIIPFVLLNSKIELCSVLIHRFVQRGEQYMIRIIDFGQRNYQLSMIFAGVAINQRCAVVGACAVGSYHLFRKRFVEISQKCLVKIKVTHIFV